MCFSVPPDGNAAASVMVISLHSFNEKNKVILQPVVAQIARKGVTTICAWLKFGILILFRTTKQLNPAILSLKSVFVS